MTLSPRDRYDMNRYANYLALALKYSVPRHHMSVNLHPQNREEFSKIVAVLRGSLRRELIGEPCFEVNRRIGETFWCTDFYRTAKDAVEHNTPSITVYWPSSLNHASRNVGVCD